MKPHHPERENGQERLVASAVAIVLTVVWALWAGKDFSWDVFNHQIYLPFSLLSGHYATDLFAAGPQSYQNPLGYLPFYGLAMSGWPSWLVGAALAGLHGLAVWPLHRITTIVWGSSPAQRSKRLLAVAAAWLAPTYLIVAGTPSVDPICGVLVLMALASALERQPSLTDSLVGGAALGLALAIKPTNLVFAIAIGLVLATRCGSRQMRWSDSARFAVAALALLLLGLGYWSFWLWRTFENPVFPLFNQIFHSPYAPDGPIVSGRFLPRSLADFLSRPFEMAEFRAYTSTEGFVPDLRLALAIPLFAVALASLAIRRRMSTLNWASTFRSADAQLAVFSLTAYVLWMVTSGNSRYAIALFLVVGLQLIRAVELAVPQRLVVLTALPILLIQFLYYSHDGDRRYFPGEWDSRPYITVQVADRLVQQPFLHLSIGMQTFASIAPHLHPSGALINAVGQFSLPMEGKLGKMFADRLKSWEGRTRFLFHKSPKLDDPDAAMAIRTKVDYLTYRLRLRVDWSDCETIVIDGDAASEAPRMVQRESVAMSTALFSCRAVARTDVNPTLETDLARADQVFTLMQARCPKVFGPAPMVSDTGENVYQRRYANSDVRVSVSPTEGVTLTHFRSLSTISMGTIDHVIANGGKDACIAWQKLNTR